jgi:hypothetical protein
MYGFGFPGQGFHCLKIPGFSKQQKAVDNVGLIRIKSGKASVERVDKELQNLIDKEWVWRVRQVAENEYIAIFPNKQILEAFSRSRGLELALYQLVVTITPTTMDPEASSVLQEGWVQLHNVPDHARGVEAVTLIAEKVGEVIVVDEVSIIKIGPVRVKTRARQIEKIDGYLEIFIEGVGYDIKFVPEIPPKKAMPNPPKPDDKPEGEGFEDDEDDDLFEFEDDPTKKMQEGSRGVAMKTKEGEDRSQGWNNKYKGRAEGENHRQTETRCAEEVVEAVPIAMFDPVANKILKLEGKGEESQLRQRSREQMAADVLMDSFLVHTGEGEVRVMHKSKWPRLTPANEKEGMEKLQQVGANESQESMGEREVDQG